MNSEQAGLYYIENQKEFFAEDGHEKLLKGLKKLVKPIETEDVVVGIDVGCCVGDYINNIKHICSENSSKILCFEPNPVNISTLQPKIESYDNVKLFKHCVSNETNVTSFHNWKGFDTNTSGNGCAGLRSGGAKICDIEVKQLDDVLDSEFPGQNIIIKFIKIDTEGNDSNVIKGLSRHLNLTKYIIFECSDCLDDIRGPGVLNPMKDIVDFLSSKGFDTYRIGTKKMLKVNDEYWNQVYEDVKFWSNCFSLRKDDDLIKLLIDKDFNYV